MSVIEIIKKFMKENGWMWEDLQSPHSSRIAFPAGAPDSEVIVLLTQAVEGAVVFWSAKGRQVVPLIDLLGE